MQEGNKLKNYLQITESAPLHPVIFDSKRVLLSLPPIINGEHSKIRASTTNVFVECTGLDLTKLNVVVNTVVTMFSQYCKEPFTYARRPRVLPRQRRCCLSLANCLVRW